MRLIHPVVRTLEKLCTHVPWLLELYARPYRGVVARELAMAGIDHRDRVVNIGCGAVPFTAMYAAQISGARVVALDIDARAVERARRMIARLGLRQEIDILHADGSGEIPCDFTAALVSLQAEPKEGILRALTRQGEPGVRIVCRRPSSSVRGQYDDLPVIPAPDRVVTHDNMYTFRESVLYRGPCTEPWGGGKVHEAKVV